MSWHHKYIGLPFLSQGRDVSGLDCWGLVRMVLEAEKGLALPSYGEIPATDLIRISRGMTADAADLELWRPVDEPRDFDVVLMKFHGSKKIGHVGIVCGRGLVLHIEKSTDSVAVPLTHSSIRNRIDSFRRHRAL